MANDGAFTVSSPGHDGFGPGRGTPRLSAQKIALEGIGFEMIPKKSAITSHVNSRG